jgi:DNA-binding SARP family transcriptional activator
MLRQTARGERECAMGGYSGPTFELSLFGGFNLQTNGSRCRLSSKKAKALLGYLAVCHGRPSCRDKLARLLWDWLDPVSARNNLRQVLFTIRREMQFCDDFLLLAAGDSLALNEAFFQVDVWQFERMLTTRTPEALNSAARLYRGELLDGWHLREIAFDDWLMRERVRFRTAALTAIGQLLEQSLAADKIDTAQQAAMRILMIDPVDESAHRALMVIHARKHHYALSLRQYQLCREALNRELGVEPELETRQLHSEINRCRLRSRFP